MPWDIAHRCEEYRTKSVQNVKGKIEEKGSKFAFTCFLHRLLFRSIQCLPQWFLVMPESLWLRFTAVGTSLLFSSWHSKVHLWMWYKIKYWIRCENLLNKIGNFYDAQWQHGWYPKIKRTWLKGSFQMASPKTASPVKPKLVNSLSHPEIFGIQDVIKIKNK